jgi:hypothetical protein
VLGNYTPELFTKVRRPIWPLDPIPDLRAQRGRAWRLFVGHARLAQTDEISGLEQRATSGDVLSNVAAVSRRMIEGFENLADTLSIFVTLVSIHLLSGGLPGHGRELKTTDWQYTMSKVRKQYGEGTFPGSRGNDGIAPI